MPTKVEAPIINDIDLLEEVVLERAGGRNRVFFDDYKDDWIGRYEEYLHNNGNPENIELSDMIPNKDKFINLFDAKPGVIKTKITDLLRYQGLTFCPFCSEAGRPNTLDHFLPKSKYPEYSILSKNLVPMCDICQGSDAKGSKVLDSDDKRMFLHPYYDEIEDLEILVLKIKPPYDKGTNFKFKVSPSIHDIELKELCIRHVKELNIDMRYREYFSSQYVRLKKLVRMMLSEGMSSNKIKNELASFYRERLITGINYWDTVFYKSVLGNDDLLEYLYDLEAEEWDT